MELDALHSDLSKRLHVLGFNHPLPLGAIGIVSAILDDLIRTSEKLNGARHQIYQLQQEKVAWELGVEPYKCDNSRLLAECNGLHLELVKQRDKFVLANTELKCRLRNLQTDKKQLQERCLQIETKIRELQSSDCKLKKDGVNMQRKPFISTVRPGYYQTPKCCDSQQPKTRCECPCNQPRKTDIMNEIERLQVETKNQTEVIDAYKKQIDCRDREIQRLGALFAGGRPSTALAKDCCYRSVNSLAEDVDKLQEEKLSIQNKLTDAMESQQNASKKIQKLSERNKQLEQELKEIENVALNVESEANLHILDKNRQNSDLQIKLHQSNMRVKELETILEAKSVAITSSSSTASANSIDSTLQNALRQASEEKRALYKQLNELKQREQTFLDDYEKIKTKYSKLKLKFLNQENNQTYTELVEMKQKLEESLNSVKTERDQLTNELTLLRDTIAKMKSDATEKDIRLAQLESEIHLLKKTGIATAGRIKTSDSALSAQSSLSVQSAFHRVERERDATKREIQQLEIERDSLRNKLQLATKSQMDERTKHEEKLIGYSTQIAKLETEKRDLLCGQSSSQATLHLLREENQELQDRLKGVEDGFSKLRISHSQLKLLHEQTEKTLSQQQNRLMCSESQLDCAEARLSQVDGTIENATKDIGKLKGDISVLKASNASLQREKDKLLMELDKKTEKLYLAETELSKVKSNTSELRDTIERLQKKFENASVDNIQKESTLRNVTSESDTLKKQVATLKRSHDNAVTENGRLSNELSDAASELTLTKRKLADCQDEVDRMKSQLREYVQEIQRAEELLCVKEREREEMLEHYKSLSEGVNMLEVSNHTLEAESVEAKKLLQEAEDRISALQEQLELRQSEIRKCERQINELSASIVSLEEEIECVREENANIREDLHATKDLCSKLDVQKEKLQEELNEHSSIREQLNKENDTLKRQLSLAKTGDKAAVDGLQELLVASRSEVEQQRMVIGQLNQELKSLKGRLEDITKNLAIERENAVRSEALANEYSVQLQEMRRMITDDRFAQVQSREDNDYNRIKIYLDSTESNLKIDSMSKTDENFSTEIFSNSIVSETPDRHKTMQPVCLNNRSNSMKSLRPNHRESVKQDRKYFSEPETTEIQNKYQIGYRGSPTVIPDEVKLKLSANEHTNKGESVLYPVVICEKPVDGSEKNVFANNTSNFNHSFESIKLDLNVDTETKSIKDSERKKIVSSVDMVKDVSSELQNIQTKQTQDNHTQHSEEQSKAPVGWKISQYPTKKRSSIRAQEFCNNGESVSLRKKSYEYVQGSPDNPTSESKRPIRTQELKASFVQREKRSFRNSHISSPSRVPSVVSVMNVTSSDLVMRENSHQNGTNDELLSIIEPGSMMRRNDSRINLNSSMTLEKPDKPSISLVSNPREKSYEEFRRSFFEKRQHAKAGLSQVTTFSDHQGLLPESEPEFLEHRSEIPIDRASSTRIARKKLNKSEQSAISSTSKIVGSGSKATIYKNALDDGLILADDKHQWQQHQQQDNGHNCRTARSSIIVIDDLRRPKTPIRTPEVSGRKAISSASRMRTDNQQNPVGRRNNKSSKTILSSSSRCEQRKWGEILQHKPSPSSTKETNERRLSLLSEKTNDRITTINYEILNANGERSSGSVEAVEVIQNGRMPPKLQPITSTDGGAGLAPEVLLNGDSKMYVLNFKIKVPANNDGKEKIRAKIAPNR
ncbi:putative leucine-rich repeat-containing protein DDB_G0290503 [Malaya genurostris]|uniref:putative leucine-rich repeat-containing protein DDB_G0290503 n=1 Tax=Malaya genurostris TaxID=325434 RepID=UPI0026F4026B|nr:putative leucine-rich repeat-containing protein DDB_G0290503 [Malaya genurostris]